MSSEALSFVTAMAADVGKSSANLILARIAWRMTPEKFYCYPGQALLAKETGLSERNVKRVLKELEDDGHLIRTRRFDHRGHRTSDKYQIVGFTKEFVSKTDKLVEIARSEATNPTGHPAPVGDDDAEIPTGHLGQSLPDTQGHPYRTPSAGEKKVVVEKKEEEKKESPSNFEFDDTHSDNSGLKNSTKKGSKTKAAALVNTPFVKRIALIKPNAKPRYTEKFEEFWESYERHGVKKAAFFEWCRLSDEDQDTAIIVAPHYVMTNFFKWSKSVGNEKTALRCKMAYAEKWLRERYFDDIAEEQREDEEEIESWLAEDAEVVADEANPFEEAISI